MAQASAAAAAQQNALSSGALDLSPMKELARMQLINILDNARDDIGLVLDPKLVGPLGLICEASLLREHRVTKIFTLDSGKPVPDCSTVIFLIRPDVQLISLIAEQIRSYKPGDKKRFHHLYFAPRRTLQCEATLVHLNVYAEVELGEFHLDLIPYDEDLLTMGLPNSFRSLQLDGDTSLCFYAARALLKMQKIYGKFGSVLAKGFSANQVVKLFKRMESEEEVSNLSEFDASASNSVSPFSLNSWIKGEIDTVLIIDRSVDAVTPLLTQRTYEGLIDEQFGIQDSYIEIDKAVLGVKDKEGQTVDGKTKLVLSAVDSIYREIRDLNFTLLGPFLKKRAAYIAQVYEERHKAETISQISEFMKKFKNLNKEHTSLQNHINIAEKISVAKVKSTIFQRKLSNEVNVIRDGTNIEDYIEELIGRGDSIESVLRLLCLHSLCNGIKPKKLEFFKQEIVQTYGYLSIFFLNNLEQAGLLGVSQGKPWWSSARKGLKLFPEAKQLTGENEPLEISSTYEGYTPLLVKIAQSVAESGSFRRSIYSDMIRSIPGDEYDGYNDRANQNYLTSQSSAQDSGKDLVTLVFVLGGVTQGEISAFRLLSRDPRLNRDYVVASTHFINGDKFISEFKENVPNALDPSTI